jgi:uncharacterized protein (TIGR00290 family)
LEDRGLTERILISWGGGKDSAMALYALDRSEQYDVVGLLTGINLEYDRVSMHGVRRALLQQQAAAIGLPVYRIDLPGDVSNTRYEELLRAVLHRCREDGVSAVAFGDLFLEDIRRWREAQMAKIDMAAVFPLWRHDTAWLARRFIGLGFRAVLTCVDTQQLDARFAGRTYDEALLADLPPTVDPCGENGEFHTFVFDGPLFKHSVAFDTGETVLRDDRFLFCDLVPPEGLDRRGSRVPS